MGWGGPERTGGPRMGTKLRPEGLKMLGGNFVRFHGSGLYGFRTDGSRRKTYSTPSANICEGGDMEESLMFERFFVSCVLEMSKEKFPTEAAFVRSVWGPEPAHWQRWQRLKGNTTAASPQGLKMSDVYLMSKALGQKVASLTWEIQNSWETERRQNRDQTASG